MMQLQPGRLTRITRGLVRRPAADRASTAVRRESERSGQREERLRRSHLERTAHRVCFMGIVVTGNGDGGVDGGVMRTQLLAFMLSLLQPRGGALCSQAGFTAHAPRGAISGKVSRDLRRCHSNWRCVQTRDARMLDGA